MNYFLRGVKMIYFDHAATSLQKPDCVAEAVFWAVGHMGNASRGSHGAALNSMHVVFETRSMISELFGLHAPERVAFTSNSTESLNAAIRGLFRPGDHVITTALEHNSVLRPLYLMETCGVKLTIIPADRQGCIRYEDMEAAVCPETRGIVCTHASNLTGNMLDLYRIGEICRRHGLLFVVDASQTAGIFPLDMREMHISALCFTGHKSLLGPQGIGGICVSPDVEIPSFKVGGSGVHSFSREHPGIMPTALEAGTLNGPGIAGLHAALKWHEEQRHGQSPKQYFASENLLYEKEHERMQAFYEGVREIPSVTVYGDFTAAVRAPIVSLNIADYPSSMVSDELSERFDIATRAGAHCAPLMHQALGTEKQGAVRFSFSHFNTMEEIHTGIEAIRTLALE